MPLITDGMQDLAELEAAGFQTALLNWFAQSAREMPWRENKDPYRIWVSEIMLQQTQVTTVRPYFERFIQAFPSVQALAEAPLDQVLKNWEGLGYYSRARNLQKGAQYLLAQHQGQLPQILAEILAVPGIGPYSAGAILSIAFGQAVPAVDGNVIRVFSRLLRLSTPFDKPQPRRELEQIVQTLIPAAAAGDFNQALMELGALICRPRQPLCQSCPVNKFCQAAANDTQVNYPVKGKKITVKTVTMAVFYLQSERGVLLQQQGSKGIFRDLWCLPWLAFESDLQTTLRQLPFAVALSEQITEIEHILTHRRLLMRVFIGQADLKKLPIGFVWVPPDQPHAYAIPVAHQKIFRFLAEHPLLVDLYSP